MATSERRRVGRASARYAGSGAHFAGCAAAFGALLAGVLGYRTRPELLLLMAVSYLVAVGGFAGGGWLVRRTRSPVPGPAPGPRPVQELLYLHVRRVDDSLALLKKSLAGERKETGGVTTDDGFEVRADLLGGGLSASRRRSVRREIEEIFQAGDEQRYRTLYDVVRVREAPDVSPSTLEQHTFWKFRLVDVRLIEQGGTAYAVGRTAGTALPVWMRLDPRWCREELREFRWSLTVVARALPEAPPDALDGIGSDRPGWRLSPLAILR